MSEGEPPPGSMHAAGSAGGLAEKLRALDRAYSPGHHGRWSARRRAELVDESLRRAFGDRDPEVGVVALAALGGYGRGELTPASDIDLLILHDAGAPERLTALAQSVLYPLWDAGLTVGHAVRTPQECLAFAVGRIDASTAMLDGRLLAGDEELFAAMRELVLGWVREDPRGYAARLAEAAGERADRYGSVSYLLEPDLKEGAGGLRDIHSLGWLRAVVGESRDLPTLDGVGLLRSIEREAIDDAEEFLVRVRSALRLETGRKGERLVLEWQPQVARDMGFVDEPGLPAVDGVMQRLFTHARQVEHVVGSVFERFLGLDVDASREPDPSSPQEVLEAFAMAAEETRVLSPSALDRIEAVGLPDEIAWTAGVREAFLRILRAGDAGVRTLEAMDRIDLLEHLIPEWGPVRCRPQRDPYHRFTVDVHLLQALAGMGRLLHVPGVIASHPGEVPGGADDVALEAARLVGDHDALLLGALLHDIGKTGHGHHVSVGARVAADALGRMDLPLETSELVQFMVEQHLLLPDTATRRDLGDEDQILDVAGRIGSPQRLAALYLLAVADAGATGPHAWTPWRRTLVRELVGKVQRVFERGDVGRESAQLLEERTSAIRELLADGRDGRADAFVDRVPSTYLLAVSPQQAVEHARLLSSPVGASEVRTTTSAGARPGTYALTVIARDRPGLLAWVAGALSLAGLSILTAQVFTTDDDVAVDLFEIEGSFEPEVGEERWREFRSALRKVIEGRLSLDHRVAEKRRSYPPPRSPSAVRITVDNGVSDFFTVIEVGAPDRIGLLFDITRTLAELELDVHLAKVATYGERVIDVFYVRDALGRKVDDRERVGAIERALAERGAG
jgi:[protein-PII] uridylyltransferase